MSNWFISDKLSVDLSQYISIRLLKKYQRNDTTGDWDEVGGGQLSFSGKGDDYGFSMDFASYEEAKDLKDQLDVKLSSSNKSYPIVRGKASM